MLTITSVQQTALGRLLGDEASLSASRSLDVSNSIQAECFDVVANDIKEDAARLNLFPVDDNTFSLQLLFLLQNEEEGTAKLYKVQYLPAFFDQFPVDILMANQPFRFDETTEYQLNICAQTRLLLELLEQKPVAVNLIQSLQRTETAVHLLRRSLGCITQAFDTCQVPACRFLAYDSEREKIQEAIRFMEQNMDRQITIRELSRKVAMNECYLKKGFKALTGKTIHEFQHDLRITKAKILLQQNNSVSEVANTLGYSSISHFSTAFKKATGTKPCELLR